ncbi:MAG: asparaginase [Chloroflexi bacterium]|nr:asparaginase [Chloroflexota bacterium]
MQSSSLLSDPGARRRRIQIVATGGTIANRPDGRVSIEDVLADVQRWYPDGDPRKIADLDIVDVLREGAETFTPAEWLTIGRAVSQAAADPAIDGIVVTHGTYTAEETAYFLHLTMRTDKPIVVACSQRKHSTIGNDGDKNLLDAVRVAASLEARGKGVMVVLNEEIQSAREVTKSNQRPSGFTSRTYGVLGTVEVDRVTFYRAPTRRHTASSELRLPDGDALPRVDIAMTYAGADGAAVRAFVEAGARGIVVNGFSFSGKPHRQQLPALRDAVEQGVAVVLANRGGDGRIPVERSDGFVRGDNLTAQKARVLLTLALQETTDPDRLQRFFDEY